MRMGSSRRRETGCEWTRVQQACWVALLQLSAAATVAECQTFPPGLDKNFYNVSCPNLETTVRNQVIAAVQQEARMAASLLRLHFHDCWPNVSSRPRMISCASLPFYLLLTKLPYVYRLSILVLLIRYSTFSFMLGFVFHTAGHLEKL